MTSSPQPSSDDVLYAFSVEPAHGRETLERYINLYPTHADQLVDLARELERDIRQVESPLSVEEAAIIAAARRRRPMSRRQVVPDPFASLSPVDARTVAQRLGVPRQVVTAFRERRVSRSSVPALFLSRMAEALGVGLIGFAEAVFGPAAPTVRSYKADGKPGEAATTTLEQVLVDAGVSEARRAELLAETT